MTAQSNLSRFGRVILLLGALMVSSCGPKNTPTPPAPPPPQPAPPPAPAPTITLRATPATVERGRPVTLQWEATNAATVRIEPGVGDVSVSGSRELSPTASVTYSATATGPGGQASDTARITVNEPPPPPANNPPPSNPRGPDISALFDQNMKAILFDYDKADIRPDQERQLQANAAWLRQNPNIRFTIAGHCDEKGSQEYNLGLGDRRASAVKQFLLGQGVPESRMEIISYGEERPVCRDATEDCGQRNRRAEFVKQ